MFITFTYRDVFTFVLANRPMEFWLWMVPFKTVIFTSFAWIYFARTRPANVTALSFSLLLFTLPYWQYGTVRRLIGQQFGYPI